MIVDWIGNRRQGRLRARIEVREAITALIDKHRAELASMPSPIGHSDPDGVRGRREWLEAIINELERIRSNTPAT